MSIEWVLVWILVTPGAYQIAPTYSPPMKTLAECERFREVATPKGVGAPRSTCTEVHILVPKGKS